MGAESAEPASTPTGAVFLSYASQDAEAAATRLAPKLATLTVDVSYATPDGQAALSKGVTVTLDGDGASWMRRPSSPSPAPCGRRARSADDGLHTAVQVRCAEKRRRRVLAISSVR